MPVFGNPKVLIAVFCLFFSSALLSQKQEKFDVRAPERPLAFFKKGRDTDTLEVGNKTLFYLVCKTSQRNSILIRMDNARLNATSNDSLLELQILRGLQFEGWMTRDSSDADPSPKTRFSSFINGTSSLSPDRVRIRIYIHRGEEAMLEKTYVLRP